MSSRALLQRADSKYSDASNMDDFHDALSHFEDPEPTGNSIGDCSETCCSETGCSAETVSTILTRVSFAKKIVSEVWEEIETEKKVSNLNRLKRCWMSSKKAIVDKFRKPQKNENKSSMYY